MHSLPLASRRALCALALVPALFGLPALAAAQAFPSRPITVVIPYPVGGTTDIVARAMQPHLQKLLGQPVLIDARTGASGMIGTKSVARAAPDGHTVLLQTNGIVITPHISKKSGVDPLRDFEPVALLASLPMVLVTHPSLPVRSVKELVDHAKANPGKIDFGSSGVASNGRLATEQFMRMAGIQMNHVPYKGMAQITQALLTGEVKVMLSSTTPQINAFVKEGKLNLLGVAALEPSALVPGAEPIARTVRGFQSDVWFALLVPKGTPQEAVARLQDAALKVVAMPDVQKAFEAAGAAADPLPSGALKAKMEREYKAWGEIVEKVGVSED